MTTNDAPTAAPDPVGIASLEQAYQAGDFQRVRRRARELLAVAGQDPAVAQGARDWLARIGVDRSAWWALVFAAVVFCAIVGRYVVF